MLLPNFLDKLAIKHESDKSSKHHDYCKHYQKHFEHFRDKAVILLELGVGGYEFPERGGSGLRMWSEFFSMGRIYGIDLYDKSKVRVPVRTKIFQGSQADGDFLQKVMEDIGCPDIIIDDASHMNELTIQSFKHLFPWLSKGGIYVIEDIESSWWNNHGFDGQPEVDDFTHPSSINFCRGLLNIVNAKHNGVKINPSYDIESIHFYCNMVVIIKK